MNEFLPNDVMLVQYLQDQLQSALNAAARLVNSLFANVPKIWTDKLQRVMNAAARVISGTRKFDRGLMRFLHHDLPWLDVTQRIKKLCLMVFKCSHGLATQYLAELCVLVADVMGCRNLCSSTRGLLNFSQYNMKTMANKHSRMPALIPEHLRQTTSIDLLKRSLKTFLFGQISRPAH